MRVCAVLAMVVAVAVVAPELAGSAGAGEPSPLPWMGQCKEPYTYYAPAWQPTYNCSVCAQRNNVFGMAALGGDDKLEYNLTRAVLEAINTTRTHPAGRRSFLARFEGKVNANPLDALLPENQTACKNNLFSGVWWDYGAGDARNKMLAFLALFTELGGEFDEIVMDTEQGMSTWEIGCNPWWSSECITSRWDAIENNKAWPKVLGDMASHHNFTVNKTADHYLNTTMRNCMAHAGLIWNAYMKNRTAAMYNEMAFEPALEFQPKLRLSQYGYYAAEGGQQCVIDKGGYKSCAVATNGGSVVGTHQTLALYNSIGTSTVDVIAGDLGFHCFNLTAFNAFKYDANRARMMARQQHIAKFKPWIGFKNFSEITRHSDYYQEVILHAGVMGADGFLFWNPYCPACGPGVVTHGPDNVLFSDALDELTAVMGCAGKEWRVAEVGGWNDPFVLSGTVVGGTTLFRFTPDLPAGGTPSGFIVATKPDLVIHVPYCNGTIATLTFPKGVVLTPPGGKPVSANGLWINQPTGSDAVRVQHI